MTKLDSLAELIETPVKEKELRIRMTSGTLTITDVTLEEYQSFFNALKESSARFIEVPLQAEIAIINKAEIELIRYGRKLP